MFNFKPISALLTVATAGFALLGTGTIYADADLNEQIQAEKVFEAVDQLNQFSQLEALIGSYGQVANDYEIPFHAKHRHHRHGHCSDHSQRCHELHSHCYDPIEARTIHMTFSMSAPFGVLPLGYNVDVTPFVISPSGEKYIGFPSNIPISTLAVVQPLNAVFVPHVIEGTYTVGYDVRLGVGSPFAPGDPAALFSTVIPGWDIFGLRKETVNSGFVALSFSDLVAPTDFLAVASNCELLGHRLDHCRFVKAPAPESVTINMTAFYGIAALPVPVTSTYNFTPFAIDPTGKVFRGAPTAQVLASSNFIGVSLNPVTIPRPIYGNYFVGYEISLALGSPSAPASTVYNFFGSIRSNPVGTLRESVNFPTQQLPLGPLLTPSDVFRVTTNFAITKP